MPLIMTGAVPRTERTCPVLRPSTCPSVATNSVPRDPGARVIESTLRVTKALVLPVVALERARRLPPSNVTAPTVSATEAAPLPGG